MRQLYTTLVCLTLFFTLSGAAFAAESEASRVQRQQEHIILQQEERGNHPRQPK